jgi:putative ATP-binding cassette transporter
VVKRVGLAEFLPTLDFEARLDKNFSLGQQQLLAFARLVLHAPSWVFLDEATSALDEVSQHRVMSIFDHELVGATVVSIGHRPGLEHFHNRVLTLVRTPNGAMLNHAAPHKPAHNFWPFARHSASAAGANPAARQDERRARLASG